MNRAGSQGFLVLAHDRFDQARALVEQLLSDGAGFVAVHLDARCSAHLVARFGQAVHPAVVISEVRVKWGHISMIRAMQALMREAIARAPAGVTHLSLISGRDWPLRSVGALADHLTASGGGEFIEAYDMLTERWITSAYYRRRYSYYWPGAPRRFLNRGIALANSAAGVDRSLPRGWHPYSGSQWWTLSFGAVKRIYALTGEKDIAGFYRFTFVPDEMLPHTILANDPIYAERIRRENLRYIAWVGRGRPRVLGLDDVAEFEAARQSRPLFFARKIELPESQAFLEAAGAPLPPGDPFGGALMQPCQEARLLR